MWPMGPRTRASTPSGARSNLSTVEGDLFNRCRDLRRGRPRRRAREIRRTQPAGAAAGKRGKPSGRALLDATSRPATGTPWRKCWPTTFPIDDRRRVVSSGVRHGRDAADRRHAGDRRHRGHERDVGRHRDPRQNASSSVVPASRAATSDPRRFALEILARRRNRRRRPDRGGRHVRPRRHRRRLRGTRRPVPRRRSGRPRAYVVAHRGCLRRA